MRRTVGSIVVHLVILMGGVRAQPQSAGTTLNVTTLAASLPVTPLGGVRMAVDRDGNTFLVLNALASTGSTVALILPDGTHVPAFVSTGSVFGQPATHPGDGSVCAGQWSATSSSATLVLLAMSGGALPFASIPMRAEALAIDRYGAFNIGSSNGPQGSGVYKFTNLAQPAVHFAAMANVRDLVVLANGTVLASDGSTVKRVTPAGMVPFWTPQATQFGSTSTIAGMTRSSWNQAGLGVVVAQNEWIPNWFLQFSQIVHIDPNGVATTASFLPTGDRLAGLAADMDRGMWIMGESGTAPNIVRSLWSTEESSAAGAPASLLSSTTGQVVTFTLDGAVGAPFLVGFMGWFGALPPGYYAPGYGLIELHPWDPMYAPAVDGFGLFGAPSPFGVVPATGQAILPATIPAGLTGQMLAVQAILPGALAPNGLFYLSQVLLVTLP